MMDTTTSQMTDVQVLGDLMAEFMKSAHREIEGLTQEVLTWKPDAGANSIGLTVWHVARWMDILGTRILQDQSAEEEQWFAGGWAKRTGYDPRGIGQLGLGAIRGYTLQEAAAVPQLSAEELLAYLDQTYTVVEEQMRAISAGTVYEPIENSTLGGTAYDWLKRLLRGFLGHIGEIQALKAMHARAVSSAVR